MHNYTKKELMTLITGKLRRNFGRDVEEATSLHMFKACALVLRDIMSERQMKTADRVAVEHLRQVLESGEWRKPEFNRVNAVT